MNRLIRPFGSLRIAVPLLIAIAIVLAGGTIYEARFGTAAVQRFIYHAWWFQTLLGFLAVNLAIAALERYPWQRRHIPFVLAHLGIILILLGGIIGGRFGIEGQLIIPEGQAERVLLVPQSVLVFHAPNPGLTHTIQTNFETRAWVHEPNTTFHVPMQGRTLEVVVDRYLPNAMVSEEVTGEGVEENPAIQMAISHDGQQETLWLLAQDAERFGARWQETHLIFLELETPAQLEQLVGATLPDPSDRGMVSFEFPELRLSKAFPVPQDFSQPVPLEGTPYTVTFKEHFTDFAITEQGVVNRSAQPNNPAIALTIAGPEGLESFLAFALHPDFAMFHEVEHKIHAHVSYTVASALRLPSNTVCVVKDPQGKLVWVLTGPAGEHRVQDVILGEHVTHPWLDYDVGIDTYVPRAAIVQHFTSRDNEVRAEALHLIVQEGSARAETWLTQGAPVTLELGGEPLTVDYRQAQRELPMTIKLLDFRKIDYPGTAMAAGFESDVEVTDPQRRLTFMHTIRMNNPLKHRGFSLFQASYIPGSPETTVLAVRNDPGTPFVYAGFVIVMVGVVTMFLLRSKIGTPGPGISP